MLTGSSSWAFAAPPTTVRLSAMAAPSAADRVLFIGIRLLSLRGSAPDVQGP
jgi:hypothetical protein